MLKRIYIEITNACNLHCAFCPPLKRSPAFMSVAFFENILKQCRPYTHYIYLHVQGEPLLHPEFDAFMSLCDRYDMQVQLVTNAVYLNRYTSRLLQHSSLRRAAFSLQSIEYSDVNVSSYLDSILNFCHHASLKGKPECEIRLWREDSWEQPRTAECIKILSRYPSFLTERHNSYEIMPHVRISIANSFTWPDGMQASTEEGTCHGTVDQIGILSDGTVVPCCLDHDGIVPLGNLHKSSFSSVYEGERCQAMRNGFLRHHVIEPYCQACSFRHRFDRSEKQK
jgi:MoaA/NifB/PqqE/SkfB family radical SAM enzyme